MLIASDLQGCL